MNKNCPGCGKEFYVKPSHFSRRVCCSRDCLSKHMKISMAGENNPNYKNAGKKVCKFCGNEYVSYSRTRKYCSFRCSCLASVGVSKPHHETRPRAKRRYFGRVNTKHYLCIKCGVEIKKGRKFCQECTPRPNRGKEFNAVCCVCGKNYKCHDPKKKKTCSAECSSKWQSTRQKGEKSHLWQGGKTNKNMLIRGSLEYSNWRKNVFERDNYSCVLCGHGGTRLAAHHIKTFRDNPELRTDMKNGVTLCWKCHGNIHFREQEYEELFIELLDKIDKEEK